MDMLSLEHCWLEVSQILSEEESVDLSMTTNTNISPGVGREDDSKAEEDGGITIRRSSQPFDKPTATPARIPL